MAQLGDLPVGALPPTKGGLIGVLASSWLHQA
jgi:hypothetical protein